MCGCACHLECRWCFWVAWLWPCLGAVLDIFTSTSPFRDARHCASRSTVPSQLAVRVCCTSSCSHAMQPCCACIDINFGASCQVCCAFLQLTGEMQPKQSGVLALVGGYAGPTHVCSLLQAGACGLPDISFGSVRVWCRRTACCCCCCGGRVYHVGCIRCSTRNECVITDLQGYLLRGCWLCVLGIVMSGLRYLTHA